MKEDIVHFYVPQTRVPLYLEMAGISYCDGSYRMSRWESKETVIEYIVEGTGYLNVNGEHYTASAGQVYILRKRTTHTYWSDSKKPWVKIFFNFRGTLAERILDEYQLGGKNKVVLNGEGMEKDFREMLDHVSDGTIVQSERFDRAAVDFLHLITKLSKLDKMRNNSSGDLMSVEDEMNTLIEYITLNPKRIVSNQELADAIFRSKDYVIKRFSTNFGVTPYEYQIQQKIFSAKNMLENTKLSVKEIASAVGYDDQHYFSYMFKKRCGLSPTQYRKKSHDEYPS
ncbi:MAG: AraC family transcriptional regulator [Tyzzerella sp.]|nr:AraC family transcriptional regulator [Tyzzerella sp.]